MGKAHIGLIGLAVMGRNLVLNLSDHGHKVAVYNRTWARTQEFLAGEGAGRDILGCASLAELVGALRSPRLVMLMVRAGPGVDAVIEQLMPLLAPGDVIIDGGNSHYPDTARRYARLAAVGLRFLGMGVSGGEEGARHGPSLMPGGDPEAWPLVRDIFQSIAAVAEGEPCCQWVGEGGAGHYVKMVHNGIEYGDMQLIAEAYQLLRQGLNLRTDQVAEVFGRWNQGLLESYLIEITAAILAVRDPDGVPRVDRILDSAGQKGTGQWTAVDALEQAIPLTLIGEAVNTRFLSALKSERERAAQAFPSTPQAWDWDPSQPWVGFVQDALYAAKLVSYAQGFMLLRAASERFGWKLAYGDIALLWRGGCIIRSRFLGDIKRAFDRAPALENLLFDDFFAAAIRQAEAGWRRAVALGIQLGIPLPGFSAALAFYDGYRSARLPASLLQAQRDYFGAHTYARLDAPAAVCFHTDWTGDQAERRVDE
ncbi:MAG: decarboxylating NADP(+)-dependent phosphogluconate dehydrogenase [Chromatiaceae bacterium]|nr:decarboxylating NADP(+)-dependent phosphogluconate dehydrogenase [Chromatiaceae bacterium]